jgi:hypothetical protein
LHTHNNPKSFEDTRENLSALDIAKDYLSRGWQPIPITYRKKKPTLDEWQKLELTEATLPKYFNAKQQNVGVQLGPRSKGLTDIDLDCAEAIALAPRYLPRTNSCFGRASKQYSHFLYYIDDAPDKAAVQHKDIDGKKMIVELRIGGGKAGAQTIFPGSTHESGDSIEWASDSEPARSTFAELKTAISKIAVGALLMRHWPQGSGHNASLALGGFLARAEWSEEEIEKRLAFGLGRSSPTPEARRRGAASSAHDIRRRRDTRDRDLSGPHPAQARSVFSTAGLLICLAYHATSRLPVRGCPVVLVRARFPVSILPRVITELRGVPQLLLGDICSETTKRRIVCQSGPGYGIMAVA